MNDADVSKQIQQMVRFIRQEAEEKANEISVSAEEVSYSKIFYICMHIFLFLLFGHPPYLSLCPLFTSQEFNIEKLQLFEAEKKKIKQDYERKLKQVDIRKKM